MRQPPPIASISRYPVTGGVALLAIGVSLAWFSHRSIEPFTMSGLHLFDQPWRIVTSIFPHVDLFHLIFNIYWLWAFGTLLEEKWGHAKLALLILVLAVASNLAEFAVF